MADTIRVRSLLEAVSLDADDLHVASAAEARPGSGSDGRRADVDRRPSPTVSAPATASAASGTSISRPSPSLEGPARSANAATLSRSSMHRASPGAPSPSPAFHFLPSGAESSQHSIAGGHLRNGVRTTPPKEDHWGVNSSDSLSRSALPPSRIDNALRLELFSKERRVIELEELNKQLVQKVSVLDIRCADLQIVLDQQKDYDELALRCQELGVQRQKDADALSNFQMIVSHLNEKISELQKSDSALLRSQYESKLSDLREHYEMRLTEMRRPQEPESGRAGHPPGASSAAVLSHSIPAVEPASNTALELARHEINRLIDLNERLEKRYRESETAKFDALALLQEEQSLRSESDFGLAAIRETAEQRIKVLESSVVRFRRDVESREQERQVQSEQNKQLLARLSSVERRVRDREEEIQSLAGELDTWKNAHVALWLSAERRGHKLRHQLVAAGAGVWEFVRGKEAKAEKSFHERLRLETARMRKKVELYEEDRRILKKKAVYYKHKARSLEEQVARYVQAPPLSVEHARAKAEMGKTSASNGAGDNRQTISSFLSASGTTFGTASMRSERMRTAGKSSADSDPEDVMDSFLRSVSFAGDSSASDYESEDPTAGLRSAARRAGRTRR